MSELTIITLCQVLSNLTNNRCHLIENSSACRCVGDIMSPTSTVVVSAAPDIMSSEVFLIFFVLAIWLSAIGFCLNQYKSLRRLETQVHYCVNRKDPLNIGDIKIVTREQDSIIYKKKRYSTLVDTHVTPDELKGIHFIEQYLPKNPMIAIPSNRALNQDDFTDNIPLSTVVGLNSSTTIPISTRQEITEYQSSIPYFTADIELNKRVERGPQMYATGSTYYTAGLTIPHISTPSSVHSSWNEPQMYDTSSSAQHLCVPSNSRRSNRLSDGNISLPVPQENPNFTETVNEQLLDPRLIPETVRRSLLALHRESQENINMLKKKEQTRSENDVHGSFAAWKIKMKSKLKRTHHQQQQTRSYSNTLLITPIKRYSQDQEQHLIEHVTTNSESQNSTSTSPLARRSLISYPNFSRQSTSESETAEGELPVTTTIYVSTDNEESGETIIETNEKLT